MGSLVILRGNSGSGKTTIAKELQKRLGRNTMRISQDAVRRDMLCVEDGPDTKALPLLMELLRYGSEHSRVVILEGILRADWYRPLFTLAGQLYPVEKIRAYYLDLSFEETVRRHQTRPKCQEFGREEMRRWWREKDFSDVLQEVRIGAAMDLEQIAAEICLQVQDRVE